MFSLHFSVIIGTEIIFLNCQKCMTFLKEKTTWDKTYLCATVLDVTNLGKWKIYDWILQGGTLSFATLTSLAVNEEFTISIEQCR